MIKAAIEKVQDLVNQGVKPSIEEIKGRSYVKTYDGYHELDPKQNIASVDINTLDGIIEFIKGTIVDNQANTKLPLYINCESNNINVFTKLDDYNKRQYILEGRPQLPDIYFNRYIDAENMIIQLQTCFEQTENVSKLIQTISKMSNVESVELADDGITQNVTAKQGVTLSKEFQLQPIVKLTPINTYREIDQIETRYLLRVSKNMGIALFEADGGAWKYDAQKEIVEYLNENLKSQIQNDSVRIIG